MPTYGYECSECGHQFEIFQRITDKPIAECEKCKGKVRRLFFPVGIVFKGSGFHVTDYRKPEKQNDDGHEDLGRESKPSEPPSEAAKTHT